MTLLVQCDEAFDVKVSLHHLLERHSGPHALPCNRGRDYARQRPIFSPSAYPCFPIVTGYFQAVFSVNCSADPTVPQKPMILANYFNHVVSFCCLEHPLNPLAECPCFYKAPLVSFSINLPGVPIPFYFSWFLERTHLILKIRQQFYESDIHRPRVEPLLYHPPITSAVPEGHRVEPREAPPQEEWHQVAQPHHAWLQAEPTQEEWINLGQHLHAPDE